MNWQDLAITYAIVACIVAEYVLFGELSDPNGCGTAWQAGLFAVCCGAAWGLLAAWLAVTFGPLVVGRRVA